MYKITWDTETGGVLLSSTVSKETLGVSPRPVFYEELDLLRLDAQGWTYPRCNEPIMWAVNKQYWYRGQMLFEAKGANIYEPATLFFAPNVEPMLLEPVNVEEMLKRNADPMFLIESEAIAFIRDTYVAYADVNKAHDAIKANQGVDFEALAAMIEKKTKQKMAVVKEDCDSFDVVPLDVAKKEGKRALLSTRIDRFIASFSGGKDSQVVLDLVTRAIPPSEYEVIYSDTGYELPSSLDLYEDVKRYYGERFPALKFSTTRNHESVLNYWDKIGTPSDTHRWCCSVMKTAPLYRSLKVDGNKQARVLTFDGVRSEESTRRSGYDRIGKGKHIFTFNAHPIINWNNVEIFLYLLKYDLKLNLAYRLGKARVGCIICPFSTQWDDSIINRAFPNELEPFLDRIKSYACSSGIKDSDVFLAERKWKIKILGVHKNLPVIKYTQSNSSFKAEITNAQQSVFTWLPAICDYTVSQRGNTYTGNLKFKDAVYSYKINENRESRSCTFIVDSLVDQQKILLLKRLCNKTAHCIACEVCEVDCPTGALSISSDVNIDKSKCIHCHRCITGHDRGCIVSDCNRMVKDSDSTLKVYGYKKFGLREEWIESFFSDPEEFWESRMWGEPMYDAFKRWAKDAHILDGKNNITPFGNLLKSLYTDNPTLVWEIIWINLSYNSFIVNKFISDTVFNKTFYLNTVKEAILEKENVSSVSTLNNACVALFDMFGKSPIGEDLMQAMEDDKAKIRRQYDDLSPEATAYSILKYTESHGFSEMRVSDFYNTETKDGPYRQFGISHMALVKNLRYLSSEKNRVLVAELNMGLDHIALEDGLTAEKLIEHFLS